MKQKIKFQLTLIVSEVFVFLSLLVLVKERQKFGWKKFALLKKMIEANFWNLIQFVVRCKFFISSLYLFYKKRKFDFFRFGQRTEGIKG
ncbi:TPA: hypothetical protein DDY55_00760 [Candidatus Falkowbacteria bacterium]|nr:hypothetical protein [Candidatus Falkowbacteria bacterium]HAY12815.1 hypothetical protein [Candidatus Falkowbacteria bacterium]HBI96638.1 hypothetical protein [Candidatus Falkowbacteria bacterium]HBT27243.1 hypothetical protein [Candidatus Falkowbacteria bacterium]HBY15047.1 hypothetical protein [Candidatus Falkowbacteria bacterium]